MTQKQVGAAPLNVSDTATKGYVDALKFSAVIGDGTALSYTVTHNRNSQAVNVGVLSNEGTPPTVSSITLPTVNTATIAFSRAPLASSVAVTVI